MENYLSDFFYSIIISVIFFIRLFIVESMPILFCIAIIMTIILSINGGEFKKHALASAKIIYPGLAVMVVSFFYIFVSSYFSEVNKIIPLGVFITVTSTILIPLWKIFRSSLYIYEEVGSPMIVSLFLFVGIFVNILISESFGYWPSLRCGLSLSNEIFNSLSRCSAGF